MLTSAAERKNILTALCVLLLLGAVGRLAYLNVAELASFRRARERMSAIPASGSLVGIDTAGQLRSTDHSAGFLLMFVVHAEHMSTDVAFWNAVVRHAGLQLPSPVRYWAICDTGNECPVSQQHAAITILGHLDPYQMSAVGAADAKQEALLYTSSGILKARIAWTGDARAVANRVKEAVR